MSGHLLYRGLGGDTEREGWGAVKLAAALTLLWFSIPSGTIRARPTRDELNTWPTVTTADLLKP